MTDNEKLMLHAANALSKQRTTIARLQQRVSELEGEPLSDAIEKSLNNRRTLGVDNTVGSHNSPLINDTLRKSVFQPKTKPVSKAARAKTEKQKRTAVRKAREASIGLSPSKFDREDS